MRLRQRQRETKKEDRSKLWEEDEEVGEQPPNKRRTLFLTETDQWKIPSPRHRTIPSFFFLSFSNQVRDSPSTLCYLHFLTSLSLSSSSLGFVFISTVAFASHFNNSIRGFSVRFGSVQIII